MIVRNIELKGVSYRLVLKAIQDAFASRSCTLHDSDETGVYKFERLLGPSTIVRGSGLVAIADNDPVQRVRIGLECPITGTGIVLGIVAMILAMISVWAFGLTLVVFWLLRDHACDGLVKELDAIVEEIHSRLA